MRSLLPPRGIEIPSSIIYRQDISPAERDTWIQLRGLAWGKSETPPISMETLIQITGKTRSTLYGHMRSLGLLNLLSWGAASEPGFMVISFACCDAVQNSGFALNSIKSLDQDDSTNEDTPNGVEPPPAVRKSGQAKAPRKEIAPIVDALAQVTGLDITLNYGRLARDAKALWKGEYTADDILEVYSPGGKWYLVDWRGKKGQLPDPGAIRGTIKALLNGHGPGNRTSAEARQQYAQYDSSNRQR